MTMTARLRIAVGERVDPRLRTIKAEILGLASETQRVRRALRIDATSRELHLSTLELTDDFYHDFYPGTLN